MSPLQVNAHDASRVKALLGLEVLNRTFDDGSDRFHLTTREREEVIQLLNDPLEEIFIKKECQRILAREARQAKGK